MKEAAAQRGSHCAVGRWPHDARSQMIRSTGCVLQQRFLLPLCSLHLMTRWPAAACQAPDDSLDLLRGATLIARHRHPLLRHEDVVDQLDDLAVQVRRKLPAA